MLESCKTTANGVDLLQVALLHKHEAVSCSLAAGRQAVRKAQVGQSDCPIAGGAAQV